MYIDADSHITPPDAMDYLPDAFHPLAPRLMFDENGHHCGTAFPQGWGKAGWEDRPDTTPLAIAMATGWDYDGMCDVEARVRDFDKLGIQYQVLVSQFTPWAWTYLIEPRLATAMARSHNIALAGIVRRHPDKFTASALVALQDVNSAIAEMEWAKANGFTSVSVADNYPVAEHPFGEPIGTRDDLRPFFAKAEALDMPILLHRTQHGHRMLNLPGMQKYGMDFFAPEDIVMSTVSLITSGILDDHPGLKVLHCESGTAWIKPLVEQLDRKFDRPPVIYGIDATPKRRRRRLSPTARHLLPPELEEERNQKPPSHYFKNNFWFTIETEEPELEEAVRFLGVDRFLFATDYPHDDPGGMMKWKDVEIFSADERFSVEEKELIAQGNAEKLFGLRGAARA